MKRKRRRGAEVRSNPYPDAVAAIQNIQRQLYGPPSRKKIDAMVLDVGKQTGMRSDNRRRYFTLWAVCALLGKEPLCRFWKVHPLSEKEIRRKNKRRVAARAKALMHGMRKRYKE